VALLHSLYYYLADEKNRNKKKEQKIKYLTLEKWLEAVNKNTLA